jgi:hypothetical protein
MTSAFAEPEPKSALAVAMTVLFATATRETKKTSAGVSAISS